MIDLRAMGGAEITSDSSSGHSPVSPESARETVDAWWLPYRRHWVLIIGICVAFVVAALLGSFFRAPVYRAEARLAVGSGQITALNVPGFPTASEQMASNYARWVGHEGTQGKGVPEGTLSLTASPIVESNVLRIEATSHKPQTARAAATQAKEQLIEAVNAVRTENDPAALIAEVQDNVKPLEQARARSESLKRSYREAAESDATSTDNQSLFDDYIGAEEKLVRLELVQDGLRDRYRNLSATRSTEAELVSVQPAEVVESDRMQVAQRNVLLALVVGLVVGGSLAQLRERRVRHASSSSPVESRG